MHGRGNITAHELELLRRVAFSSLPADRAGVLALFAKNPNGLTVKACAKCISKGESRARQLLDELEAIKLVEVTQQAGRKVYQIASEWRNLLCVPPHLAGPHWQPGHKKGCRRLRPYPP